MSSGKKLSETSYQASPGEGKEFIVIEWELDKTVISAKQASLPEDAVQIIGRDGARYKPSFNSRIPNDEKRMCWMPGGKAVGANVGGELLFIVPASDAPIQVSVGPEVITVPNPKLLPIEEVSLSDMENKKFDKFDKKIKEFFATVEGGRKEEMLVSIKADRSLVGARYTDNMTALHLSARDGDVEIVEALIANGAKC